MVRSVIMVETGTAAPRDEDGLWHEPKRGPLNLAWFVRRMALQRPDSPAYRAVEGCDASGDVRERVMSFGELDRDSDAVARGLAGRGVSRGTRVLVMLRPGLDFVAVAYGLFKAGAVPVFIDPGMGLRRMARCVREAAPEAFVGVPRAHLLRRAFASSFGSVGTSVVAGGRLAGAVLGATVTLEEIRKGGGGPFSIHEPAVSDPAGIFFTSGSTGRPKGVIYTHAQLRAQAELLRGYYRILPGEVDMPTFALFLLYSPAYGATGIIPRMDYSRPGSVDPRGIVSTIAKYQVTHSFGSPELWRRVVAHCRDSGVVLPSLRRVLVAGAPVPTGLLRGLSEVVPNGLVHIPYGATEALPVCSIDSAEVLSELADAAGSGRGLCVGRPMPGVKVRIVDMEKPACRAFEEFPVPPGTLGEIAVSGPVVSAGYLCEKETEEVRIHGEDGEWHRMGDVGYEDGRGRIWYCGRKRHIVDGPLGRCCSIQAESVLNELDGIRRTALVPVEVRGGSVVPAVCVEFEAGRFPRRREAPRRKRELELAASRAGLPAMDFLFRRRPFPVDRRHNAKIEREELARWARGRA